MNFGTAFRNRSDCGALASAIRSISKTPVTIMEVCGGHTMSIHRFGIPSLLPDTITLVSGPGCPVCVSDIRFIDHAIALARRPDVIVATYGDLLRVPGSSSSLEKEKAGGADIRITWSTLDAVSVAEKNPEKKVVFLGIGFETTAPATAISVLEAQMAGLTNYYVLSAHKIMPPAMMALIDEGVKIDAYLCPGHVSVVTGCSIYEPIVNKYRKPCVISGFEPADILQSIWMIVQQVENDNASVKIQYTRAVQQSGNKNAQVLLDKVFTYSDDYWRGIGAIPRSGLKLSSSFEQFDAAKMIPAEVEQPREVSGCICGEILKGLKKPTQCPLFKKRCTPDNPVGACMVSGEGTCAAYFQFDVYER